ncbi:MAG: acetyl-CoA carboxylase carboxyltransferase subunit beta [Blastochloris viridis]|uniref:Acetyl-coenzyme A carboxylase carboxyl transferase subunit beta n=1 Tax=Blastochloris viridis TaxID=1079 RepID=A0A6N4R4S3_BLAVI|nr:MAG: acetyl-CoA carboxylase carboxyltransferase subunit beta [Blastochloris viridis]
MSFLTDLIRPSIKTTKKREVAADVWEKCPGCGQLIYAAELPQNLFCCTHCNHHLRWDIDARLEYLLDQDEGKAPVEIAVPVPADDPLNFKDKKAYKARLKDARAASGHSDAFRALHGHIESQPVAVCALDFGFMAGSMSRGVGEALVATAQYALEKKIPMMVITASGGARMQESTLSLMQMARSTAAIAMLKEAGLPYLVLLTDPTTGGVSASFAMTGDVHMAEPGALIGFAGARVIEQTIRQTLPEGFQRAEYLLEHGMVDMVTPRSEQRATLAKLLGMMTAGRKA